MLLWVFFVEPTAFDQTLPLFERLINVAYPAGDLLLIAIGAQLAVRQVRRQAPYWIVSVALLALLVADLGYLYQSLYGVYNEARPGRLRLVDQLRLDRRRAAAPSCRRDRRRAAAADAAPVAAADHRAVAGDRGRTVDDCRPFRGRREPRAAGAARWNRGVVRPRRAATRGDGQGAGDQPHACCCTRPPTMR